MGPNPFLFLEKESAHDSKEKGSEVCDLAKLNYFYKYVVSYAFSSVQSNVSEDERFIAHAPKCKHLGGVRSQGMKASLSNQKLEGGVITLLRFGCNQFYTALQNI